MYINYQEDSEDDKVNPKAELCGAVSLSQK